MRGRAANYPQPPFTLSPPNPHHGHHGEPRRSITLSPSKGGIPTSPTCHSDRREESKIHRRQPVSYGLAGANSPQQPKYPAGNPGQLQSPYEHLPSFPPPTVVPAKAGIQVVPGLASLLFPQNCITSQLAPPVIGPPLTGFGDCCRVLQGRLTIVASDNP